MKYSRVGKNARLGDGYLRKQSEAGNAHAGYMSTDSGLLDLKSKLCKQEGIVVSKRGTQKSGYGGTKTIYKFHTKVDDSLTKVINADIKDIISDLDEVDIMLWFVDDGSWHVSRNTMHLYCNMFNDEEVELLSDKIEELYGVRPTKRIDRKKDGRQFNYLYFPRWLVATFRPKLKSFLLGNQLESLYYKFGGIGYEDQLEKLIHLKDHECFSRAYNCWTGARSRDKKANITTLNGVLFVNWVFNGNARQKSFHGDVIS